jgi:hypothetical protein
MVVSPPSVVASGAGGPSIASLPISDGLAHELSPNAHSRDTSELSVSGPGSERRESTPYNVRNEQAPTHRFYTREFQSSVKRGISIAKKAEVTITESGSLAEPGEALERLLQEAKRLSTFQGSDTSTIAVLGDSGEGTATLATYVIDALKLNVL